MITPYRIAEGRAEPGRALANWAATPRPDTPAARRHLIATVAAAVDALQLLADGNAGDAQQRATTAADELAAATAALASTPPDHGTTGGEPGPDCGDTWDGVGWDGTP